MQKMFDSIQHIKIRFSNMKLYKLSALCQICANNLHIAA